VQLLNITQIFSSQTRKRWTNFPGKHDLIHVDGQQDGDGSLHDLELALRQGRFIFVDRYFWTRDNFLAVSESLYRNRDLLKFYGVIPGVTPASCSYTREVRFPKQAGRLSPVPKFVTLTLIAIICWIAAALIRTRS